ENARDIARTYWPGALSMVLPSSGKSLVIPRQGTTLMVRVPAHDVLLDLLATTGPVASTSANRHGELPAQTAAQARQTLSTDIDLVVEGDPGAGRASTIIDCTQKP